MWWEINLLVSFTEELLFSFAFVVCYAKATEQILTKLGGRTESEKNSLHLSADLDQGADPGIRFHSL